MSEVALRTTLDPASIGWPATLPLEIALREHSVADVCAGYGIDKEQWKKLVGEPRFREAVARFMEQLKTEGMTFKLKAQLQSELLLKQSWKLIHDVETPANVRADLIKQTWKVAGHEPTRGSDTGEQRPTFAIAINLGDTPTKTVTIGADQ